ncbi:MAG TPA: hypothetical protein VNO21_22075 [Polyangiaceae bacterium]|nr:hypothetical protein [Polyangiaceae bacterium]
MTARQKIESLTKSWYGFAAYTAIFLFLRRGFDLVSLIWAVGSLATLPILFLIGRRLLARGHITRIILLVLSPLAALSGSIAIGQSLVAFFDDGSLALLLDAASTGLWVFMNARSFIVLVSEPVRAYFD